jgi:hypothetical protein
MKIKVDQSSVLSVTEVTQQLRKYAHELCKESGIKINAYCSMLAAELANVQQYLEELGDAPSDAAGEHRVLRLLDTLEKLCHVSSRALLGIDNTA